jgi:hypothetical protein
LKGEWTQYLTATSWVLEDDPFEGQVHYFYGNGSEWRWSVNKDISNANAYSRNKNAKRKRLWLVMAVPADSLGAARAAAEAHIAEAKANQVTAERKPSRYDGPVNAHGTPRRMTEPEDWQ